MNRSLALATLVLILGACDDRPAPEHPSAVSTDGRPVESASASGPARRPGQLATPLPEKIQFDFPYFVRHDGLTASSEGNARRQVVLIAREPDVDVLSERIVSALTDSGFERQDTAARCEEDTPCVFAKPGFGVIKAGIGTRTERKKGKIARISLNLPQ